MQKPKQKSRQSSIVFKKLGILPRKLKVSRDATAVELNIFC